MLEAEEVDDDYFTPVASASLANIFGKSSGVAEKTENESLKYTPPKPHNVNKQPESKSSACIFACALVAYEWLNQEYQQTGKVGFAIVKIKKAGTHNMILYDANKTALSNVALSNQSKVTLKNHNFISYYDSKRKYWSLYGNENEINKITDLLKSFDVVINTSTETDINPPKPIITKTQSLQDDSTKQVESDTDSLSKQKTKVSILTRMANMGHSVLPASTVSLERTSDSSDTTETDDSIEAIRHKPMRKNIDKSLVDHQKVTEILTSGESSGHITDINTFKNDQLVPLVNTGIITSASGNDLNVFITEQRINNTELRINIGRVSDKMDHLAAKINQLECKHHKEGTTEINTGILNKLLREYEKKIKYYEDLFQKMDKDLTPAMLCTYYKQASSLTPSEEILKNTIIVTQEKAIKEKSVANTNLKNEIQSLEEEKAKQINDLQMNISKLEKELCSKETELKAVTEANVSNNSNSNVDNKIKTLMNDTYQAVASNFEDEKTYSGESTKKIIAMVIKKVTISALNDP